MSFPRNLYEEMFEKVTGNKLNYEEELYFFYFTDIMILSPSKKIFYYTLYYMKRFYPLVLTRFIIELKVKSTLKKENAPQSIQKLYKEIAEIIILTAMKNYAVGTKKIRNY